MGLLLWEEPFYDPAAKNNERFFHADHILEHHTYSLGVRIRLAPTVSLGSTGNMYQIQDETGHSTLAGSANYGVLLKPIEKLEIGLAYFDFPSSVAGLRQEMEGIQDESVNGGVSFFPDERTILAIDMRDASGAEKINWHRFRLGFERTFWKGLALRLGYFQTGRSQREVYSLGLGLNGNSGRRRDVCPSGRGKCRASYALLIEEGQKQERYWHLLSVLFAI
jgi:hypothetical protein